jgi:hypothetical protein
MKRIGWYAVDWNTPALQFYEKVGLYENFFVTFYYFILQIGGRNLAQKDGWLNFRIFLDDINCLVREESNDLSSEKNQ